MSKLAEAIKERGADMSLREMARELDVAVGTIEGWSKGWRIPDLRHVPKLAVWLRRDVSEVVDLALTDLGDDNPDGGPATTGPIPRYVNPASSSSVIPLKRVA